MLAWGSLSKGDPVPHFMVTKRPQVLPSGATVTVTTAGMLSAQVPPKLA